MRLSSNKICLIGLIALSLSVGPYAYQERIPDLVARGVTGRFGAIPSGKTPTVAEVLQKTDVVVRGVIGEPRGYLSPDMTEVYTDYDLKNPVILFQTASSGAQRPGIAPPLMVTLSGGEVTIGTVKYAQYEEALPALPSGAEGLFLLERTDGRYMVADVYLGAFSITSGRLFPLTHRHNFADEYRDMAAAEAISSIVSQIREFRREPDKR